MDAFSIHPDTQLGSVHLAVSDLARSLSFYVDLLGMRALQRGGDEVVLGAGDRPLLALVQQPGAQPRPPRTTGLYHFALLVPSRKALAQALRRLEEMSYPLGGASDHLVSEALYLSDPDGIGIEICADRPREAWLRPSGELRMATDPLDLESLRAELQGDGQPWGGLPDGVRMGHVHLQVADLQQAEGFYRDLLGFDLTQRYGPSASFLSAGGYHHHIAINTWAGVGAPPPPADAVGLRYFTVCLPDAADLRRVAERVRSAGLQVKERAEGILLRDPSGNGILLEQRGRTTG